MCIAVLTAYWCGISSVLAKELTTAIKLSQQATIIDISVPMSIPITVMTDGDVVTASGIKIINNNYGAIKIDNIAVETRKEWVISKFTKDYSSSKVGLKEFGLRLDSKNVTENGLLPIEKGAYVINGYATKNIPYTASVAPQINSIMNESIANIVLTVSLNTVDYVLVDESSFNVDVDGIFTYIGFEPYIELPAVLYGKPLTNIDYMFSANKTLKGLVIPNTVNSMYCTFSGCTSLKVAPVIPEAVIDLAFTFEGCTSLGNAPVLPKSIKYMENTFEGCSELKGNITIPSGITQMEHTFDRTYMPINLYYTRGDRVVEDLKVPTNVTKIAK